MKVLVEKFIAKVMDECYSKKDHGFVLKKLLDSNHIKYDETDQVYLFTEYNPETKKLNGYPLKQYTPAITLGDFLEYWDKYLEAPAKNTVYFNWIYHYKTRYGTRYQLLTSKKGTKYYNYKYIIEKHELTSTVVDHLNLYLVKENKTFKKYIIYLTSTSKFVSPKLDISTYRLHIKEV